MLALKCDLFQSYRGKVWTFYVIRIWTLIFLQKTQYSASWSDQDFKMLLMSGYCLIHNYFRSFRRSPLKPWKVRLMTSKINNKNENTKKKKIIQTKKCLRIKHLKGISSAFTENKCKIIKLLLTIFFFWRFAYLIHPKTSVH